MSGRADIGAMRSKQMATEGLFQKLKLTWASVYSSASAEELPIMWVDGELDRVLQLAHTHTHTQGNSV